MRKQTGEILFNIAFWSFVWILFFLSMLQFEPIESALFIATLIVCPLIIPVYIHNYLFSYFVIQKQYFFYILTTAIIVAFFGYIIDQLQELLEPEGESETYGALLFMMIFYTGAKYARIGTNTQFK